VSVVQQAIDYWTGDPAADARASARLSTFATVAAKAIAEADAVPVVPDDRSAGAGAEYVGWYESVGRGRVAVSMHPNGMEATAGALRLLLAPGSRDNFAAYEATISGAPRPFKFRRDASGAVDAFVFREVTFLKR
jgi:hypothetical protein